MSGHFSLEKVKNWYRPIDADNGLTLASFVPYPSKLDWGWYLGCGLLKCSVECMLDAEETDVWVPAKSGSTRVGGDGILLTHEDADIGIATSKIVDWFGGDGELPSGFLVESYHLEQQAEGDDWDIERWVLYCDGTSVPIKTDADKLFDGLGTLNINVTRQAVDEMLNASPVVRRSIFDGFWKHVRLPDIEDWHDYVDEDDGEDFGRYFDLCTSNTDYIFADLRYYGLSRVEKLMALDAVYEALCGRYEE